MTALQKTMQNFALAAFMAVAGTTAAMAQDADVPSLETNRMDIGAFEDSRIGDYINRVYIAYIPSGNGDVDSQTERGLQRLSEYMSERTSINPAGIVRLDPESDDLSLFPVIFASSQSADLFSNQAIQNIQAYMRNTGIIVFDMNGDEFDPREESEIQALATTLGTGALEPLPERHPLAQSLYLVSPSDDQLPQGDVWVQRASGGQMESVGNFILTEASYAAAWAGMNVEEETREHEIAIRWGINLFTYALTGNMKQDASHQSFVAERLLDLGR